MRTKNYLTIEGLYKGFYDAESEGVWMTSHYNPVTGLYEDCYTWFELWAVYSLDRIKTIRDEVLWTGFSDYRRPYGFVTTILRGETENGDFEQDEITISGIQSLLTAGVKEIHLDFRPYMREGNPHEWGDFEPMFDRDSVQIVELVN